MKMRRFIRHIKLAIFSSLLVAAIYLLLNSSSSMYLFSMATAYTGLLLLAVTLVIGPLRLLRNKANPVSDYLRRDIGIWAAIVSIIHVIIGLQRHLNGQFWLYFVHDNGAGYIPRFDVFGFANYTGLLATLIFIVLLALSNNVSLRKLGSVKWKNIQRFSYIAFLLVIAHGFLYQFEVNRPLAFVIVVSLFFVIVLGLQWKGLKSYVK